MQSIFAGAELAGWTAGKNVRIDHVGFGVVLGEDKYDIISRFSLVGNNSKLFFFLFIVKS